MATAGSEILKQNPNTKKWTTGGEWYNSYINIINTNSYITGKYDTTNTDIEPKLKSNKDKPLSAFITKKELLEKINLSKSKIKSVELKTYKEHILEDDPTDFNYSYIIDLDRIVWVVIAKFPDGIDTKGGFFVNATLVTVYDGESGEPLKSHVSGDRKSYSH